MTFPERIWIERSELDTRIARTVRARAGATAMIQTIEDARDLPRTSFSEGKRSLVLQRHRGTFLQACPAGTGGLVCCNYMVMNFASNCPYDCSYCFLQSYLSSNSQMKAFTNVEDGLNEVATVLRNHPQREFRIGTGELADSLALDPITGLSQILVPFFSQFPNVCLELKTKSDCINDLLELDPNGRVVVSWSVNASSIVRSEEQGTAPLEQRLDAARRVAAAGYRVGFHIDPLVEFDGWETEYAALVESIYDAVPAHALAWVSLGSLRLTPALEGTIRRRARPSRILGAELVRGHDGKARVWHGLRVRMYRHLMACLDRIDRTFPTYLCMEGPDVWDQVMKEVPTDRALGMRLAAGAHW